MGSLLEELTRSVPDDEKKAPQDVVLEASITENLITSIDATEQLGPKTVYTCPDCGGVLFEHKGDAIVKLSAI